LFEKANFDAVKFTYNYASIDYDENKCGENQIARGTTIFPYGTTSEVRNAYAALMGDTLKVKIDNKQTRIPIYKTRTDVTDENIAEIVKDQNYNSGLLRIKSKYLRSLTLFDVTYGCRMGNGDVTSKEGSKFLGKGFIHITGKNGYKAISVEWNKLYPKDTMQFHGKDIALLETNVEVALKASMIYWKINNLNQYADKGTSPAIVEEIGVIVNGGNNGMDLRKKYTKLAVDKLK
jgi:hypothetical protein